MTDRILQAAYELHGWLGDWLYDVMARRCEKRGHIPRRIDPGDPDAAWQWWCPRCGEEVQ